MSLTRRHVLGASIATLGLGHRPAFAQPAWPARPISFIAPYGAGGSNDILTRLLGEDLPMRFVDEPKKGFFARVFGG